MLEGDKAVLQRLAGADASLLVHGQHSLQQVDELPAVGLLRQQFSTFQLSGHIDLAHVI